MPYGERDSDCGLAFVCYGASIADGFEFIQRNWCMRGDAIGLAGQTDMLVAPQSRLAGMTVPAPDGGTVFLPAPPKAFTTVVGCAYLFVPSRSACEWLRNKL